MYIYINIFTYIYICIYIHIHIYTSSSSIPVTGANPRHEERHRGRPRRHLLARRRSRDRCGLCSRVARAARPRGERNSRGAVDNVQIDPLKNRVKG